MRTHMAFVLGVLERTDRAPAYFVHCASSGFCFPRLFASPDAARRALDEEGIDGLIGEGAAPDSASVARLSLSSGWSPAAADASATLWGIASASQLLTPLDVEEGSLRMVVTGDVAHIACEVALDGDRDEERALCTPESPLPADAHLAPASEPAVHGRRLCPDCIAQVSGGAERI